MILGLNKFLATVRWREEEMRDKAEKYQAKLREQEEIAGVPPSVQDRLGLPHSALRFIENGEGPLQMYYSTAVELVEDETTSPSSYPALVKQGPPAVVGLENLRDFFFRTLKEHVLLALAQQVVHRNGEFDMQPQRSQIIKDVKIFSTMVYKKLQAPALCNANPTKSFIPPPLVAACQR